MSPTPRTDAARGFHDMDTAVSAEDMAQLETELAAAKLDAEDQAKWALWYLARAEKAETQLAVLEADFEKLALSAAQAADRNVELRFRAEKAEAKIITARSALSRIANSDYRGNRSTESQIAFAALEEIK